MEPEAQPRVAPETVAGVPLELVAPQSYAERWEVYNAMQDAAQREVSQEVFVRLLAGALGLCWPKLRRFLQKERTEYTGDLRKYGGQVIDFLAKQPDAAPTLITEIIRAGQAAHKLCQDGLLTKAHMEAAQGFSKASGENSSSLSSPSSAPGTSNPDGSAPFRPSTQHG